MTTRRLPLVASSADLPAHAGERVRVRGRYGVQDLGGHTIKSRGPDGRLRSRQEVAYVRFEDGTYVQLAAMREGEMCELVGWPVEAIGVLFVPEVGAPSRAISQPFPAPRLTEIESIEPLDQL